MIASDSHVLAPSESVLLNGDRFAQKAVLANVDLLHIEAKVSAADLGRAILSVAFLSSEQAGALRLEARTKKAFLGLASVKALYAEPTAAQAPWPDSTIEGRISQLAEQWQRNKGQNEVSNIVYSLLGEDSVNPWQHFTAMLKAMMASRGILQATEERKLKIFTSTRYALPAGEGIPPQPAEPLLQLLAACERDRPEIWKLLQTQIKHAIRQRTERSTDTDFDNN